MFTSIEVANYFIAKSLNEKSPVTPMKLQKLVFFAHGWHLAIKDVPLLDEQVEAWVFGPVVQSLYHKVKWYGNTSIKSLITDLDFNTLKEVAPMVNDQETKQFLDTIWNAYKVFSGVELSNITHLEGSPWYIIVNLPENKPLRKNTDIPQDIIKEFFKKSLKTVSSETVTTKAAD